MGTIDRGPSVLSRLLAGAASGTIDVTMLEDPWRELAQVVLQAPDGERIAAFEGWLEGRADAAALRHRVFAADPVYGEALGEATNSDLTSNPRDYRLEVRFGPGRHDHRTAWHCRERRGWGWDTPQVPLRPDCLRTGAFR